VRRPSRKCGEGFGKGTQGRILDPESPSFAKGVLRTEGPSPYVLRKRVLKKGEGVEKKKGGKSSEMGAEKGGVL